MDEGLDMAFEKLKMIYDEAHHALNTEAKNKEEVMRANLQTILTISGKCVGYL